MRNQGNGTKDCGTAADAATGSIASNIYYLNERENGKIKKVS